MAECLQITNQEKEIEPQTVEEVIDLIADEIFDPLKEQLLVVAGHASVFVTTANTPRRKLLFYVHNEKIYWKGYVDQIERDINKWRKQFMESANSLLKLDGIRDLTLEQAKSIMEPFAQAFRTALVIRANETNPGFSFRYDNERDMYVLGAGEDYLNLDWPIWLSRGRCLFCQDRIYCLFECCWATGD